MKFSHSLAAVTCALALSLPALANEHDSSTKLRKLDTDNDGRISRAEFDAGKQQKFDKMDANNDGVVTTDEKAAKAEKKHWWSRSDKAEKAARSDTNNDGQLTPTENAAAADAWFSKADTNRDGYLTQAELDAAYAASK